MHALVEVAGFGGLGARRRFLAFMLKETFFKFLPQVAVVQKAQQLSPVHGIETLEQWALQQIFIFHKIPRGPCPLWPSNSPPTMIRVAAMGLRQ